MGTIDTTDCSFSSTKNYEFLKNLPVYNSKSFTKCFNDQKIGLRKICPKSIYDVPIKKNEKQIRFERVPFVLNYLKNHWNVYPDVDKKCNLRSQKRENQFEKSDETEKNNLIDIPKKIPRHC